MYKFYYITLLIDTYGELLTTKQREVMTAYYFDDNSLHEIAEAQGITRQAVQDMLKRTEKLLNKYEEKLSLVDKYMKRKALADEALKLIAKREESGDKCLSKIKDIIARIAD